jgi:hypothetical protein
MLSRNLDLRDQLFFSVMDEVDVLVHAILADSDWRVGINTVVAVSSADPAQA